MNETVRLVELPLSIRSFTVVDEHGTACIYVNKNLCFERQQESCQHELSHILNDDFHSFETADTLERIRHDG